MNKLECPSCKKTLIEEYAFCPFCGFDLKKPVVCRKCHYPNENNSKYCQECGHTLFANYDDKRTEKPEPEVSISNIPLPPKEGITVEFPYSSSQSYDFAVESAKKLGTYQAFGESKKIIHRINVSPNDVNLIMDLIENLKGWRSRVVYVNGEKVPWDSVFSFSWCYERRHVSFKPEFYCFGYENEFEFNIWGCIQAHLPFNEHGQWFSWGSWLNRNGDWKFDKERILHELHKTLFNFKFCPAFESNTVEDAISALPDTVNPRKDKDWKFLESWGNDAISGLTVTINRFGFEQTVVMKGVCPNGTGALKIIAQKMRRRIPAS